jgi:hypothetical protein
MQNPDFARIRPDMLLVHDKAKIHSNSMIPGVPWRPVVHPARSPDLMPLDYGFFGFTKNQLGRAVTKDTPWETKVKKYKELLLQAPAAPTIGEFPLRLQACLNAKGMHFDAALRELKRQRSPKQ